MKKIFLFLLTTSYLYSLTLTFEQRQDLIYKIKQTIVNEELISKAIEKYIENNFSLPTSLSDLSGINSTSLDTTYFNDFSIGNLTTQNLIIDYSLKDVMDDVKLKALYEADTFRVSSFFYSIDSTIRVILSNDLSRHIYGLIKKYNTNITSCTTSTDDICLVDSTNSFRLKNSGTFLYEYKVENYRTGPMTITSDTTLHTNSAFDLIPNGVNLMDANGKQYIKTNDGISILE